MRNGNPKFLGLQVITIYYNCLTFYNKKIDGQKTKNQNLKALPAIKPHLDSKKFNLRSAKKTTPSPDFRSHRGWKKNVTQEV